MRKNGLKKDVNKYRPKTTPMYKLDKYKHKHDQTQIAKPTSSAFQQTPANIHSAVSLSR